MPTVYVREKSVVFHRSADCFQLKKGPARGPGRALREVPLEELPKPRPCRYCYPDAPRARSRHRYCQECKGSALPCEHNGGVLVTLTNTHTKRSIMSEPGDTYQRTRYVWPEQAHLYTS